MFLFLSFYVFFIFCKAHSIASFCMKLYKYIFIVIVCMYVYMYVLRNGMKTPSSHPK